MQDNILNEKHRNNVQNGLIGSQKENMTPTLIVPIKTDKGKNFKVRTMLDSGSSANWIAKDLLQHIKFTSMGKCKVQVHHFGGIKTQTYQVVQIYIDTNDALFKHKVDNKNKNQISIECFVNDEFTFHRMVPGIKNYIKRNYTLADYILDKIIEPNTMDISHANINKGTALILSNTTKIQLMGRNSKNIRLSRVDLLLEQTIFGYCVSGKIPDKLLSNAYDIESNTIVPIIVHNRHISECQMGDEYFPGYQAILSPDYENLDNMVRMCWEKELSLGVMKNETHTDDEKAIKVVKEGITFDNELGQFSTPLPFNGKEIFLKSNIRQARLRTFRENEKMNKDKKYLVGGIEAFNKMKENNSIEKITPEMSKENIHFLPWRFVIKDESVTTGFRLCMDASARPTKKDFSLNQCLLQGPNMTLNLAKCLIRFTLGKMRVVSDIEKAFLMISIWPEHRNYLRFFWPEVPGDLNSKLIEFRFRVVLFGSISSPFLLAIVLEKIIEEDIEDKIIKDILRNGIYVDNLNSAINDVNTLKNLYKTCREVFMARHFNFRQWSTNNIELKEMAKRDGVYDDRDTIPVLGKLWCGNDELTFRKMKEWNGVYSKWATLSFGNGAFDPTGELAPILVQIRSFIRQLWSLNLSWTEDYSDKPELVTIFDKLRNEIKTAMTKRSKAETIVLDNSEIHIFSDASNSSIGAVMYIVTPPCVGCKEGNVKQIFAKAKLTPPIKERSIKEDTIPRWELLGMLMGAQIANFVTKDIDILSNKKIYIWGDSKVALSWCSSEDLKDNFVIRRVIDIRKLVPNAELRYVDTSNNPADILTRNITGQELLDSKIWWGPDWLKHKEKWPKKDTEYSLQTMSNDDIQMNFNTKTKKLSKIPIPTFQTMSLFFNRFSFYKAIKAMRWAFRWRNGHVKKSRENNILKNLVEKHGYYEFPTNGELIVIENEETGNTTHQLPWDYEEKLYVIDEAFKIMQRECYYQEYETLKSGKVVKFGRCKSWGLTLDDNGVIRCGSNRILETIEGTRSELPKLVHGNHPMIESFVRNYHEKYNCCAYNDLVNKIKPILHGINLNLCIKNVIKACNKCMVVRAVPYSYPGQKALPLTRLRARRPFSCVGVDFSGPHLVRDKYETVKVWVCLFTCMVTRAVYLVRVNSCGQIEFVNALMELFTRRGQPDMIMSDNATNFTSTANVLKKLSQSPKVIKTLNEHSIQWDFIPPNAPWQGGNWERLIGLMKKELNKLTRNGIFSHSDFDKHLMEIELILNSRPLCEVGNSEVITPAHFLNCHNNLEKEINSMDRERFFEEVVRSRKEIPALFKQVQILRENFWTNLWAQYLDKLRFSYDKTKNRFIKVPKIGEVCIIWDDGPRNGWKKGVILEFIQSEDEQFRSCKVQTANGVIIRPLKLLYSLEITETDTLDRKFHTEKIGNNPNDKISENYRNISNDTHGFSPSKLWRQRLSEGGSWKSRDNNLLKDSTGDITLPKNQRSAKIDALGKIKQVSDWENGV